LNALVTGGAGFIGSHVVEHLVDAGHDVSVLDNLSTGSVDNIPPGVAFHRADITDRKALDEIFALERPELICHLAAQTDVRRSINDPVFDAVSNVIGSINVIDSGLNHGMVRMLYANSGGAIYGDVDQRNLPVSEDAPIAPLSPYGVSKYAVEQYLGSYSRVHDFAYTSLRLPNVYGPRQDPLGEAGVIAIFLGKMLANEPVIVFGDGLNSRDYTHVSDIADAFLRCVSLPGQHTFNLGTGVGTTVLEIAEHLSRITGYERSPQHAPSRSGEVAESRLNASRAARDLGWKPSLSIQRGLEQTSEFFLSLYGSSTNQGRH
jgi:UDP-glucose 4-epimerase